MNDPRPRATRTTTAAPTISGGPVVAADLDAWKQTVEEQERQCEAHRFGAAVVSIALTSPSIEQRRAALAVLAAEMAATDVIGILSDTEFALVLDAARVSSGRSATGAAHRRCPARERRRGRHRVGDAPGRPRTVPCIGPCRRCARVRRYASAASTFAEPIDRRGASASDRPIAVAPVGLAQLAGEDLARIEPRQSFFEVDRARRLVRRESLANERNQLAGQIV